VVAAAVAAIVVAAAAGLLVLMVVVWSLWSRRVAESTQTQNQPQSCDLLRVGSKNFKKKKIKVVRAHPQQIT